MIKGCLRACAPGWCAAIKAKTHFHIVERACPRQQARLLKHEARLGAFSRNMNLALARRIKPGDQT